MPKRSRAERRRTFKKASSPGPKPAAETVAPAPSAPLVATPPPTRAAPRPFSLARTRPTLKRAPLDYSYVRGELVRIGIITASILGIIVLLAFLLPKA